MKSTRIFYNCGYLLYPLADLFFLKQKRKLAAILNSQPEGRLLEIGVGNGSMLPMYERHTVSGIDLSSGMLSLAAKRRTKVPVHLYCADAMEQHFPAAMFDYIVISHTLSVVRDPERVLQHCHEMLRPAGKLFVLNHFTPPNLLALPDLLLTPLARLLQFRSYFRLSSLENLNRFRLLLRQSAGPFGYYQILVLQK